LAVNIAQKLDSEPPVVILPAVVLLTIRPGTPEDIDSIRYVNDQVFGLGHISNYKDGVEVLSETICYTTAKIILGKPVSRRVDVIHGV